MKLSNEQFAALQYGASGIAELGAGFAQMRVGQARANYQRVVGEANRKFADLQAEDVVRRGEKAARARQAEGRRVQGAQRAAMAAQGIDIASGSAADIQAETETLTALDANEIRNSSWMQSWGIKANAENDYATAMAGADALDFDARSGLAIGGMRAMGQFGQAYRALDLPMKTPAGEVSAGSAKAQADGWRMAMQQRAAAAARGRS